MGGKRHATVKPFVGVSTSKNIDVAASSGNGAFPIGVAEHGEHPSNPWFRSLFESSPVAHLLMDGDWRVTRVNASACKLLKLNDEQIQPEYCLHARDLIGESAHRDLVAYYREPQVEGTKPYESKVVLRASAKPATAYRLTCISMPASDECSCAYLLILCFQDEVLSSQVANIEKGPEAIRAKSDFLAMMSHEIRTPMNSIVGFAELMRSTCENEEQETYLEQIESSAYVLLNLINDILDFSKIDSGGVELKNKQFNLAEQLEVLVEEFGTCAEKKGVELHFDIDTRMPHYLEADEYCILQILNNLLSNAVKFTDEGEINIVVDFIGQERNYVRYAIHVIDTGIGIAQADQSRVFQVFSQIDNSSTRRHGGTGLGLAISRKLARILGGEITIKSDIGQGAKFSLYLTSKVFEVDTDHAGSENGSDASNAEQGQVIGSLKKNSFNSMRILLVEDDEVNQLLFVTMLSRLGFKADIASNGQEALERIQNEHFDLVFMDLQMPKMGGLEVALRTRQNRSGQQPYLIAVTANTGVEVMEMCFNAGMDDYLSKPLNQQSIVQAIRKFRERRTI